jgi:transposase InsO family protein
LVVFNFTVDDPYNGEIVKDESVANFVKFYNSRRIHGSINWLSPEEYYHGILDNRIKVKEITA